MNFIYYLPPEVVHVRTILCPSRYGPAYLPILSPRESVTTGTVGSSEKNINYCKYMWEFLDFNCIFILFLLYRANCNLRFKFLSMYMN